FNDMKNLFRANNDYIRWAYLDAERLKFVATREKPENISFFPEIVNETIILKAFLELVMTALKLKARAKYLARVATNPFRGDSFYAVASQGKSNYLVLQENEIKELATVDILVKIGELKTYTPGYDKFPLKAQLAVLDLAYTGSLVKAS